MSSKKPEDAAGKPDLVTVILERDVAQKLALALAWALGSTGGGKSQGKGSPKQPKGGQTGGGQTGGGGGQK